MNAAANLEEVHRLAPIQQGLLIESTSAGAADPYVVQLRCRLRGPLDPMALRAAWQSALDRHEILRTSFHWRGLRHPVQAVHRRVALPFEVVQAGADEVAGLIERDRRRGFDLASPPLMRLTLARLAADDHVLVWTHHHLLLDGWSVALLLDEVLAAQAAGSRAGAPTGGPTVPHSRYVDWLRDRDDDGDEGFWRAHLNGFEAPGRLALDRRPELDGARWRTDQAEQIAAAGSELLAALRAWAAGRGVTLATALQAAWALLLRDHSGADDVAYGLTVSTRPTGLAGADRMLGPLVNTLPVRALVPRHGSLTRWVRELHARQLGVAEHAHASLSDVQRWSGLRDPAGLFDTALAFENYPADREVGERLPGLDVSDVAWAGGTGFPLTMLVVPDGEGTLKLRHQTARFDARAAARLAEHFRMLLAALAGAPPDLDMAALPSLPPGERQRVVVEWNAATGTSRERDEPVHVAVARWARSAPDAVAVRCGAERRTYAELDRAAGHVGAALSRAGAGPGTLVALFAPTGPSLLTALLGVLKAGAAYVPLDPLDPPARRAAVLEAARPAAVLADPSLAGELDGRWPVLRLDAVAEPAADAPAAAVCATDAPAYVLYTSGTTGTPKGVVVSHRALSGYLSWCRDAYDLGPGTSAVPVAPAAVDLSVTALLGPLIAGGTVALPDPDARDAGPAAVLRAAGPVDVLKLTPSHLELLAREGALDAIARHPPRHLVVGGESLRVDVVRPWREALPEATIWNEYGPTETTVACCAHRGQGALPVAPAVPIGRPIAGARLYVLDALLRPVPPGITGELYVGGDGLALGYLGDPALTAQRFLPDPFAAEPAARMYRTGDLVRLDDDDRLVHAGRIDAQVKVRGHRVEPGDVEAHLVAHPAVVEAAVVRRAGSPALAAYVVAHGEPAPSELAAFLAGRLPAHMVPSSFEALAAIPRTPAGKTDRRALAARSERPQLLEQPYIAPRTSTERVLAELWESVLGVDRLGALDDFFLVGGESLAAMAVAASAGLRLGVDLTAGDVLECRTIARLASRADELGAGEAAAGAPGGASTADDAPVSAAQSRFFVLHELDPTKAAYNTFGAVRLEGALSPDALRVAVEALVARHTILRAVFRMEDGRVAQSFLPPERFALVQVDLTDEHGEPAARALELAREEARAPFDLAAGPLLRLRLYRIGDGCHLLALVAHHIVSDGRSFAVMVGEVARDYAAALRGEAPPAASAAPAYADLARRERREPARLAASLAFWRERLRDSPALALTPDRGPPAARSYAAGERSFELPPELWAAVTAVARRNGATPFATLLAALRTALASFAGRRDVAIGAPVARRDMPGCEATVGPALNTVVLRGEVRADQRLSELLAAERTIVAEALAHADLPFERLIDELARERDLSRTPLFQVLLDFQRRPFDPALFEGLVARPVDLGAGAARFDLELDAWESGATLGGRWTYAADVLDPATVEGVDLAFRRVLEAVARRPDARLGELDLLAREHRERLEAQWDADARELPGPVTVQELFLSQAERAPDAQAVVVGERSLTYGQLARASGAWAGRLRSLGVGPETCVGVLAERSPELAIGVVAALRAGAAYLPLDPALPDERLRFMLADSGPAAVLCSPELASRAAALGARPLVVAGAPPRDDAPPHASGGAGGANVAYVIYTSGSTGVPKGVAIEHAALRNRLLWMQERFGLDATDRVLHKTPISFDVHVWELLWPLATGATMVMAAPGGERDGPYLAGLMASSAVTTVHFVPSLLGAFLEDAAIGRCRALRRVIVSGEALTGELRDRFHAASAARLFNLYGPTEAAIDVTAWECRRTDDDPAVPIGTPVANTRIHVVDDEMRLVSPRAVGELCIGGVQVGRGYVGRPGLTADRFRPDPFARVPGARLYRTGDRARHRHDGTVEYLGRIDDQVKVRGQRIELGEVEAALAAHPAVRECAVAAVGEGTGTRLAAYYATAEPVGREGLEEHLRARLPAGMVPSLFVVVDALPRTPGGKVERRALPAPDPSALAVREWVAPSTPAEWTLATIWEDVLGVDRVGVDDGFFELGGDSIRALRMVARAAQARLVVRLADVYLHPTLGALAAAAGGAVPEPVTGAAPFPGVSAGDRARLPSGVVDAYPVTALQAGMVFEALSRPSDPLYNNVDSLHLRAPFDAAALRAAAQLLVDRHDALRTSLEFDAYDRALQLVHAEVAAPLAIEDLRGMDDAGQERLLADWFEREKTRDWDLSAPPLLRFRVHRRSDETLQLSLPHHHAILDGWSLATLCTELAAAYLALLDGREPALPPLPPAALRAYVAAERRASQSSKSRDHWRRVVGDAGDGMFPAWLPLRSCTEDGHRTVELDLGRERAEALADLARAAGVPLKTALLTAHCEAVGALTGRDDVLTGVVADGRLPLPNGESVLGLFLNSLPFRAAIGTGALGDVLRRVFAAEREHVAHRHVPMERILRDSGATRLYDTWFNYTNFHLLSDLPRDPRLTVLGRRSFTLAGFPLAANFNLDPETGALGLSLTCDLRVLPGEQVEAGWRPSPTCTGARSTRWRSRMPAGRPAGLARCCGGRRPPNAGRSPPAASAGTRATRRSTGSSRSRRACGRMRWRRPTAGAS